MFRLAVLTVVWVVLLTTSVYANNTYQRIIDDIYEQSGVVVTINDLKVFEAAGNRYGVHWRVMVSQWYQESRCGNDMGNSNPLVVLAKSTKQLDALNRISANLGIDPGQIKSGNAGELGPMQFRPTIWQAYGKDLDGDGKADPWNLREAADAAARFLKQDCGYLGRNTPFGALAHYNGGYKRRFSNEHYANVVARRAAKRWGAPLDL